MSQRQMSQGQMGRDEVLRRAALRRARIAKRKRQNRIAMIRLLVILVVLIALTWFIVSFLLNGVYRHVYMEAGEMTLQPADFQKNSHLDLSFADGYSADSVDTHVPGDYDLKLKSGLFTYKVTVTVRDTVAPSAEPMSRMLTTGTTVEPAELVQNLYDETKVTATFVTPPDFSGLGRREVDILLTDLAGNQTTIRSELFMIPTKDSLYLEMGSPQPEEADFYLAGYDPVAEGANRIQLLTDLSTIPMDQPGEYEVRFRQGEFEFSSTVFVVDTEPPSFVLQDVTAYSPLFLDIEEFIVSVHDKTPVSFAFVKEPDLKLVGTQNVTIRGTDTSGNASEGTAILTIVEDLEPPVLFGVYDFHSYRGDPVSYLANVTATDNSGKVEIQVNADAVDTSKEGDYTVIYTAVDGAGNQTVQECTVSIIARTFSEAEVREWAQEVLRWQITEDMTDYEKLKAIYFWIRWNIHYVEMDIKDDWLEGAYYGLQQHRGDCYVFFATAKALLTEAGIRNKDIDTRPLRDVHYWNLVDIGQGWMHFDTVPREEGDPVFLYIDDETIQKYSERHHNSHIYDQTRFPDVVWHQETYPEEWEDYSESLFPWWEDWQEESSSESSESSESNEQDESSQEAEESSSE